MQEWMNRAEAGWDLYRTFLAVVREGNFSAASRSLGLTQPTVGRQIQALEEALGAPLFRRSRRGLTPTPAAMQVLPHAEAMATAAAAVQRTCSDDNEGERGSVRLSAGQLVSGELLPSPLAAFCREYPNIEIEVSVSDRNEDVLGRDVDLAVRMVNPTQQALVARKIGMIEIGLFAHASYVQKFGLPKTLAEFKQHRTIGFDRDGHGIRSAGGLASQLRREHFGFRCDHVQVQLAALRAGAGIGGHQVFLARQEPGLVRVLPQQFSFKREMWLVMHKDLKRVRRVRVLFDHLARSLAQRLKQVR